MRRILLHRLCLHHSCLFQSTKTRWKSYWSCRDVRATFVDYFKAEDHAHVPSSSVLPSKGDGTYFTNAGMNQFKPIFLGNCDPSSKLAGLKRAVNSQKCIRVGGKHNDLEDVGHDLTHLTFFEMLGNWSFGDYFKERACRMALDLLTTCYGIPKERLYFTYFGGDERVGLPADEQCRDIWASLGISRERILPFGSKDNFWDMGVTGPCGPCTEIHFDHLGNRPAMSEVNAESPYVVEVWNLVFIQYDRQADQSLRLLPQHHVDTGMGLERITAALNGTRDNYATDAFRPLFSAIQNTARCNEYSGSMSELDTAYRILADHSRMFTVAMSDGLLPSSDNLGHKLRGIIHRCIRMSRNVFKTEPALLLPQLASTVASSLQETYVDLQQSRDKVRQILDSTIEHHDMMYAQNIRSFKKMMFKVSPVTVIPGYAILDLEKGRYGSAMPLEAIVELAGHHDLSLDTEGYNKLANRTKQEKPPPGAAPHALSGNEASHLVDEMQRNNVLTTDDSFKYLFSWESRVDDVPSLSFSGEFPCSIQGLGLSGRSVQSLRDGQDGQIVLDKTCFYPQSGGQEADHGILYSTTGKFSVSDVQVQRGYVVHHGHVTEGHLRHGQEITPQIFQRRRQSHARNHTATHLLNAALLDVLPTSQQEGSDISAHRFSFDFLALSKVKGQDVEYIEQKVREVIKGSYSVESQNVPLDVALDMPALRLLQHEVYPQEVRVVSIQKPDGEILVSRELCGGTHVDNTSYLEEFCITHLSSRSQNVKRATCTTGLEAHLAHQNGRILSRMCEVLQNMVDEKGGTNKTLLDETADDARQILADLRVGQETFLNELDAADRDCDGSRQLLKDVEKAIVLVESVRSELASPQACPIDSTEFMQGLVSGINKARQLELMPKTVRDRAHLCLENNGHKVSELINASHARRLHQQIDSCLTQAADAGLNVVHVDSKMNSRQVFKLVGQKVISIPLALIQKGESTLTLLLSLPTSVVSRKADSNCGLDLLTSSLSHLGPARGKVSTRSDGSAVYSVTLKGRRKEGEVMEVLKGWIEDMRRR